MPYVFLPPMWKEIKEEGGGGDEGRARRGRGGGGERRREGEEDEEGVRMKRREGRSTTTTRASGVGALVSNLGSRWLGLGDLCYDSSSIVRYLHCTSGRHFAPRSILPRRGTALSFVVLLVNKFFDDWYQSIGYHHRWNKSVKTASEEVYNDVMNKFIGQLLPTFAVQLLQSRDTFARRQVSRLPYHMSYVGNEKGEDGSSPPPTPGFPCTTTLLEASLHSVLDALETALSRGAVGQKQRKGSKGGDGGGGEGGGREGEEHERGDVFLLGPRPTLADAAVLSWLYVQDRFKLEPGLLVERKYPNLYAYLQRCKGELAEGGDGSASTHTTVSTAAIAAAAAGGGEDDRDGDGEKGKSSRVICFESRCEEWSEFGDLSVGAFEEDGEEKGRDGGGVSSPSSSSSNLSPLMIEITETYLELMYANERAYATAHRKGQRRFNEPALLVKDEGAIYDVTIRGTSFRHVIKTFHVKYWRNLKEEWRALDATQRALVMGLFREDSTENSSSNNNRSSSSSSSSSNSSSSSSSSSSSGRASRARQRFVELFEH